MFLSTRMPMHSGGISNTVNTKAKRLLLGVLVVKALGVAVVLAGAGVRFKRL